MIKKYFQSVLLYIPSLRTYTLRQVDYADIIIGDYNKTYNNEVKRLKGTTQPLNVVFMVLYSSVWKYDSVYKLMDKDPRFNPLILVCPIADYGREHMIENFRPTVEMFKNKGYNVLASYNEKTGKFIDVQDLNLI